MIKHLGLWTTFVLNNLTSAYFQQWVELYPRMIVSKTRNAPGWATKADNLIPNGVKCNENVILVSVLRLGMGLLIPWWDYHGWDGFSFKEGSLLRRWIP